MTPYYEEDGITIYHGDCRDALPHLPNVDLVLTDPPYGKVYWNPVPDSNRSHGQLKRWVTVTPMPETMIGDDCEFNPAPFLIGDAQILWGANHYAHRLPHRGRWLIWDKRCQMFPQRHQADCEMAWCSDDGAARIKYHYWDGMARQTERFAPRVHPTQKPLDVMRWCLGFYPKAQLIFDPFCGSGTTLLAAKELGMWAIGIEIEERYCEIAANRLRQGVLNFSNGNGHKAEQAALI